MDNKVKNIALSMLLVVAFKANALAPRSIIDDVSSLKKYTQGERLKHIVITSKVEVREFYTKDSPSKHVPEIIHRHKDRSVYAEYDDLEDLEWMEESKRERYITEKEKEVRNILFVFYRHLEKLTPSKRDQYYKIIQCVDLYEEKDRTRARQLGVFLDYLEALEDSA